MQFTYKETGMGYDMLTIKTAQHIDVEFLFEDDQASHVYLDGYEFPLTSDTLFGLFVAVGGEVLNLIELSRKANEAFPAIKAEVEQEGREQAAHEREMSCPRATGRI